MNGVLTKTEILERLALPLGSDPLFISPLLDEEQINDSTINLRLGQHFLLQMPSRLSVVDVFELANQETSTSPIDDGYAKVRVPYGSYFTLHAGQMVRIGSLEYLGMPKDLQGDVTLRHSVASVPIHASVATIQPGYRGIVVLSLHNNGLRPIQLYPGMPLAQLELRQLTRRVDSPKISRYSMSVVPEPIKIHKDKDIQFLGPSVNPLIIGIVSTIAAGRTRAVEHLQGDHGFLVFSLSAHLKDRAFQQGIRPGRAELQDLGNKLRGLYGKAYLAEQLRASRQWLENRHPFIVVDSFKHCDEVKEFQKQDRFYLLGIDAPVEMRRLRAEGRRRPGSEIGPDFYDVDRVDRGIGENIPSHHLEVDEVMRMAFRVIRNDGTLADLHEQLDDFVGEIKSLQARPRSR